MAETQAVNRPPLGPSADESIALVDELCLRYRNWGRWGAEDERGTLNFITPDALKHAATMIKSGRVVSCALPFNSAGPQSGGFGGRTNPLHSMLQDGGDIALGAQDHLAVLRYTDDAVTGVSAILKSWAIGPICAAVINPPEATMTNTRYMTQKIGVRRT